MARVHNKLQGRRLFPVGAKVRIKREGNVSYKDMSKTFDAYETRGYMVVTGHSDDGWLRFDNIEYTRMGGSWNPNRFEVIIETLPEDLFEI